MKNSSKEQELMRASAARIRATTSEIMGHELPWPDLRKILVIGIIDCWVKWDIIPAQALEQSRFYWVLGKEFVDILESPVIIAEAEAIARQLQQNFTGEDIGSVITALRDFAWTLEDHFSHDAGRKRTPHRKKQQGIYETPPRVAQFLFLLTRFFSASISSVLDPASGSGNLLDPFWEHLPNCTTMAIDTDEIALLLAEIRFLTRQIGAGAQTSSTSFNINDFLEISLETHYDVIVANPPWGLPKTTLKKYNKANFPASYTSQVDSWALFMEKATSWLTLETGILGFIIPNTLSLNPNFERLRKYLLRSYTILFMLNLGERIFPLVTQPALLILVKNSPPPFDHEILAGSFAGDGTLTPRVEQLDQWLPKTQPELNAFLFARERFAQRAFLDTPGSRIELFSNEGATTLLQKIDEMCPYTFGDFVTNGRGVEIGKHAVVVQCSQCGRWNPPPKPKGGKKATCNHCHFPLGNVQDLQKVRIISENRSEFLNHEGNIAEVIVGEQLSKYIIKGRQYIRLDLDGINYKVPSTYSSPKIIVRKTGREIHAAIDWDDRFTVQVVYIFKPKSTPPMQIPIEVLLCLLNSRLLLFYYYHRFGDPEKSNYAHYIQKHLKMLPIPNLAQVDAAGEKITSLTQTCQKYERFGSAGIDLSDEQVINEAIYLLYNLNPFEIEFVEKWAENF